MHTQSFSVSSDPKPIPCIFSNKPSSPRITPEISLVLTHGAGGTLTSPAIANFSNGFSRQMSILCFQGNSNLGSRTRMFSAVIDDQKTPFNLGGRSMGARAAVMAATKETQRLVLVSYPLHTGSQLRDQILLDIDPAVEVIFVSGDRDTMCDLTRLEEVRSKMQCRTWRLVVEGADHGMDVKPKRFSEAVGVKTGEVVAEWIKANDDSRREGRISCDEDGEVKWTGWEGAEKGTTDSPKAMQESSAARKNSSDLVTVSESKAGGKTTTKVKPTSKKRKSTTHSTEPADQPGSKKAKRTKHPSRNDGPKQESVSGRTRVARRAQFA
ncbi:MAG: hypothetical protein Q9221_002650 [Calogaya cf. arnoldii]